MAGLPHGYLSTAIAPSLHAGPAVPTIDIPAVPLTPTDVSHHLGAAAPCVQAREAGGEAGNAVGPICISSCQQAGKQGGNATQATQAGNYPREGPAGTTCHK